MPDFDDLKKFADEHDKQVDEGLQKAGDQASQRFGHQEQVEKAVNEAQERTGSGDQVP
jgi:F0F1-type ATP synthase membrane subunit b/b'